MFVTICFVVYVSHIAILMHIIHTGFWFSTSFKLKQRDGLGPQRDEWFLKVILLTSTLNRYVNSLYMLD